MIEQPRNVRSDLHKKIVSFQAEQHTLAPLLKDIDTLENVYLALSKSGKIMDTSINAMEIRVTHSSNSIEQNPLTLSQTAIVLAGYPADGITDAKHVREALDHHEALEWIEFQLNTNKEYKLHPRALDLHDVQILQKITLNTTQNDIAGVFRPGKVMLAGAKMQPPSAAIVHEAMPDMVKLANDSSVHPVIRAAEVHYNLAMLHPFCDGNGRTARLLMNFVLLRSGYPLTYIDSNQRPQYIDALEAVTSGKLTPFASLVANRVLHSLTMLLGTEILEEYTPHLVQPQVQ